MNLRKLVSILMALVMMLAFASVGVAESDRTEIVIWHTFTDDQEAMLQTLAEEFNASQDQYTVVVQSQPYSGFENSVLTAVTNGVGPDMIIYYSSTVANYIDAGLVADLGKYVYDEEIGIEGFDEALPAAILAEASSFSDNTMHCIPLTTSGPILFYNKDLFAQAEVEVPTTWDEMYEVAKVINEKTGVAGLANDSLTDTMQAFVFASGSTYIDTENKVVGWNNDDFVSVLDKYAQATQDGSIALTATGDYWSSDFNAGIVASYIGSCAGVPYIEPDGFEYDVAPMVLDSTNPWYPAWNRSAICFSTTEEKERGTYEFIKFFVQPENNSRWCMACNYLSPYSWTAENEEYAAFVEANPALAAVNENLDKAGYLPNVFGASTVRSELEKAATMACSGAMSTSEAVAEAAAACDAELANGK
ncbi:MAG: extracellular solute-binding protein [Clostridia bacterium]|nr:extracellular solute-binding protein [Clostridia bacterium]